LIELDSTLNTLKSKYSDFNEVEVLQEADRLGVKDLEFVYNALRGKKLDNIKETLTKQIENDLTEKIRKNGIETQTIINSGDTVASANHGLTPEQLAIAAKMKLTPEQYARGLKT
jgi:PHP family Zn ribbon phosphoesterase